MTETVEKEEYVYGHVLEALSGGLYPNKLDVIREYLQNSFDAISECLRQASDLSDRQKRNADCKIIMNIQSGSLFIYDNATGMNLQTLNEYRKIGFSRRPFGKFAGWRGIGKAAGLAVAEKVIVTTSEGKGETHQLVLEASQMIEQVHRLRASGRNIPFNELIQKNSTITTTAKGPDSFTNVELHRIKPEASELLDKNRLISHVSTMAPVPFRRDFKYAKRIEEELSAAIEYYMPVNLYFGEEQIFKPYKESWQHAGSLTNIDEPEFVSIYDENEENLVAFCWYCMHSERGQIKEDVSVSGVPMQIGGLVYRIRDIRIGDAYLTRRTLWRTTPERSLWALGEIHILDENIEPTSDRNDLIDNNSRYNLYQQCTVVAKEISRRAGKLSQELVAKDRINAAQERIEEINLEISTRNILKPSIPSYIYEVTSLNREVQERRSRTLDEEFRKKADNVIVLADRIVKDLTESRFGSKGSNGISRDIIHELHIGNEGKAVYDAVMDALQDYFAYEPRKFEELVHKISNAIQNAFSS